MQNPKISFSFSDFLERHSEKTDEAKMSKEDENAILSWLARIGEVDPEVIKCVVEKCRVDADALKYFLSRAKEFRGMPA